MITITRSTNGLGFDRARRFQYKFYICFRSLTNINSVDKLEVEVSLFVVYLHPKMLFMNQENIFIQNKTKGTANGLIIKKQEKQILSKQQQTFNKLAKRIEKLRQELEQTHNFLDDKLDYYSKHIYPLEQQLTSLQKEVVRFLYTYFTNRKLFSKNKKKPCVKLLSRNFLIF